MKSLQSRIIGALVCVSCAWFASAQVTVDTVVDENLSEPHSVAVDVENNVYYLTDSANHRIVRFNPQTGVLKTIAGVTRKSGRQVETEEIGLDVESDRFDIARFNSPRGIVLDSANDMLYVADTANHAIRRIDISALATNGLARVTLFAGLPDGSAGPAVDNAPAASAAFNSPLGLALDEVDRLLYIADSKNKVIRRVSLDGGPVEILGTAATAEDAFFEPTSVAVDRGNNRVYVADGRDQTIKLIDLDDDSIITIAGTNRLAGYKNSFFSEEALFNFPSGLVWLGDNVGLLVADSGNHVIRRIFEDEAINAVLADQLDPDEIIYSVELFAGIPGFPGFVNGAANQAQFSGPINLADDGQGGILITDFGNSAIRRLQLTPPQPRVEDPEIGLVTFVLDDSGVNRVTLLVPFNDIVLNNEEIIAIRKEDQTEARYTFGTTPAVGSSDTIEDPEEDNSQSSPPYSDGILASEFDAESIVDPSPDMTIKAIGFADGRRPSQVAQSRVRYKAGTPLISGDNLGSFEVSTSTVGAEIYYSAGDKGSIPDPSPEAVDNVNVFGPFPELTTISFKRSQIVDFDADQDQEIQIKIRAFYRNAVGDDVFNPSEISSKVFSTVDFEANRITFGFERGEGSTQFLAAKGQTYFAPVTLSLLPDTTMFSLQFGIQAHLREGLVEIDGSDPNAFSFQSMLLRVVPGSDPRLFIPMPAGTAAISDIDEDANGLLDDILPDDLFPTLAEIDQSILFRNGSENLLSVAWIQPALTAGQLGIFSSAEQDLISFSQARNTLFEAEGGKVILGGYALKIPTNAEEGDTYEIQIVRPSATKDGVEEDLFLESPQGELEVSLGPGTLNGKKVITVGSPEFLVGDVVPFGWFNAGDFGDGEILNNDIVQIFQAAVYNVNTPPPNSDLFKAMDSCCNDASGNPIVDGSSAVFNGDDSSTINLVAKGDGILNVSDVMVTFRRSIDATLDWYVRFWDNNGVLQAANTPPNVYRGELGFANSPGVELARSSSGGESPKPSSVVFWVEDVNAVPGEVVSVPVRSNVSGDYPMKLVMFNLNVSPASGGPGIKTPVAFAPASKLGSPKYHLSKRPGNYSGAWLERSSAGIKGDGIVGQLIVKVPDNAPEDAVYRVEVEHASASYSGLDSFPVNIKHGLITMSGVEGSSYKDGIPDRWRYRYFGSLGNLLSARDADADGDGLTNGQEFQTGTDPNNVKSVLAMQQKGGAGQPFTLRWPSEAGKTYRLEATGSLSGDHWIWIASGIQGSGHILEYAPSGDGSAHQFYRVTVE